MKFKQFDNWIADRFGGLTFAALCAKNNVGAQGDPGPVLVPTGEWVGANSYLIYDAVTFEGSSYYATQAVPENSAAPDQENSPYWFQLAAKGDTGAQGDPGTNGDQIDISALAAADTPLNDVDLLLVSQGGVLKKVAYAELKSEINPL